MIFLLVIHRGPRSEAQKRRRRVVSCVICVMCVTFEQGRRLLLASRHLRPTIINGPTHGPRSKRGRARQPTVTSHCPLSPCLLTRARAVAPTLAVAVAGSPPLESILSALCWCFLCSNRVPSLLPQSLPFCVFLRAPPVLFGSHRQRQRSDRRSRRREMDGQAAPTQGIPIHSFIV